MSVTRNDRVRDEILNMRSYVVCRTLTRNEAIDFNGPYQILFSVVIKITSFKFVYKSVNLDKIDICL